MGNEVSSIPTFGNISNWAFSASPQPSSFQANSLATSKIEDIVTNNNIKFILQGLYQPLSSGASGGSSGGGSVPGIPPSGGSNGGGSFTGGGGSTGGEGSLGGRLGDAIKNVGATSANTGLGLGVQYLGGMLGNIVGGEGGQAIGQIGGNLSLNILKAGNFSQGWKNFIDFGGKENFKKFGSKDFKGFGNAGNLALSVASGVLDRSTSHQRLSGKYGSFGGAVDMAGNLISTFGGGKFGGYGALGQFGMSAVNKITGGTDGMTLADAALGSSSMAGALTTINPILGAAYVGVSGINSATGATTRDNANNDYFSKENLASMWGSYGKSYKDHLDALLYGGKKYGGISRLTGQYGRADRKVRDDNVRTDTIMDIYDRAELGRIRGSQMADINSLDYRLNTYGGYDLFGTYIGRNGMKLPSKDDILKVKLILSINKEIDSFKKGGQMSVIPEGALHARLHHMETGDKITRKGIPVVDKQGEQLAEIERNEIIFSLELTNKLEALRKDGSDKAAIEAGKLLVEEIFNNTDDRTGLIQEVVGEDKAVAFKQGGSIIIELPSNEEESFIDIEEPVGIEEVEYYQEGGNIMDKLDEVRDLHKIVPGRVPIFVLDNEARTDLENGIIYYTDDESKAHEYYGHFQPDLKLLAELAPYWLDLNDEKLQQFGTDLEFVKRLEGDPNIFFSPEELLGRILAARYMLKNDAYRASPEFLSALSSDELKYGSNLRDLLHMYNPEVLSEIFRIANRYPLLKFKEGGIIVAEKPSIDEIEEFGEGNKIHKHFVYKPKLQPKFEDWIKDVNPEYTSSNYDLKMAYHTLPFEDLERWKFAVNSDDPEFYMNYLDENGKYVYHLGSVAELDNGDYMFLKKGTEDTNPEIKPELEGYYSGENGLKNTHDLKFEGDRYFYRRKKTPKKEIGGIIDQINKLSPDKMLELEHILKYLNQ